MNTSTNNPNPPNGPAPPDPLAVALSKLDPAPHGFDWNALMFAAGRASKARALAFWRAVAAVCAVAACGFALAYFAHPPVAAERVVYVDRPAAQQLPHAAQPVPAPTPEPLPRPAPPKPTPIPPAPASAPEPLEWSFEAPAEAGAAVRWLDRRNEVLTVGLSVLPDSGRKLGAPGGR